jgi:PAS domain-containing protein
LPIGIGVFDAQSRLVYSNESFRALRSLPETFCAPGTALIDIIRFIAARGDYGADEIERLVRDRFAEATSGKHWEIEQDIPAGRLLQISHTPTPDGGVTITYADVTEARATERKLRESEERYGLVSQAVAEGIYDWNVVTNALYVSEGVMEILGLEGYLTSGDWFARVYPDDAEGYRIALRDCFRGLADKVACQYRQGAGHRHWNGAARTDGAAAPFRRRRRRSGICPQRNGDGRTTVVQDQSEVTREFGMRVSVVVSSPRWDGSS